MTWSGSSCGHRLAGGDFCLLRLHGWVADSGREVVGAEVRDAR